MAGLGAGELPGGRLSVRLVPARGALRRSPLVELAIGVFGALSGRPLLRRPRRAGGRPLRPTWRDGASPTCWPSGSRRPPHGHVPALLVRGMVLEAHTAGRTMGILYGVNLLGAAWVRCSRPGCWCGARDRGARSGRGGGQRGGRGRGRRARRVACRAGGVRATRPFLTRPADRRLRRARGPPLRLWVALYALSGFVALSLEIVWFRIIDVAVKATRLHVRHRARALPRWAGRRVPRRRARVGRVRRPAPCLPRSASAAPRVRGPRRRSSSPSCARTPRSTTARPYWAPQPRLRPRLDRGLTDVFRLYVACPLSSSACPRS